jgi:hypothetical protein
MPQTRSQEVIYMLKHEHKVPIGCRRVATVAGWLLALLIVGIALLIVGIVLGVLSPLITTGG